MQVTCFGSMGNILYWLSGRWYVISTDFSMWLKGDKRDPQFHYSLTVSHGVPALEDKVTYTKHGKLRTITGVDLLQDNRGRAFTWHGKGLLGLLQSKWEIRLMDEQAGWAVILFDKTIFTPGGVDIISRYDTINGALLADIKKRMLEDPQLKPHANRLVNIRS